MKTKYDVIIIGAGIIGCTIAFELAKQGKKTLNIDKLPAAGNGSTANSCAVVRMHYSTLDGTAVAAESFPHWKDWEKYLGVKDPQGTAEFRKLGIMLFKSERNKNLSKVMANFDELGISYEDLDKDEIKVKYPSLSIQSFTPPQRPEEEDFGTPNGNPIKGAITYSEGGYITDPILSVHNVQVAAENHGAEFIYKAKVTGINKTDGRVQGVQLEDGSVIEAPVVVNAAGPHSFVINRLAGVEDEMNIKTKALRHEVVQLAPPEGFKDEMAGMTFSDNDIAAYWRPEVGGNVLTGSQDPACDPQEWIEDPDEFNRNLTEQAKAQACRLALRIPELSIPNQLQGVVDLYDVADDWIPIYDKSVLPGFYMAVGTSGNQYKTAPVVGKMMAELITQCEKGQDHDQDPVIYHLERMNHDINMKFFSRLREINRESSFSVTG